MLQHVRIADGFRSQSAEQLAATAGGIITGLTGNPAFPSPSVELKTVQGAVDELNNQCGYPLKASGKVGVQICQARHRLRL